MKHYLILPICAVVLIAITIGQNTQHQAISISVALISIVFVPMMMAYAIKACIR